MDIIFQSGEFYGQDSSFWTNVIAITGAVLGALISGLIAIWVFKRGLKEQKKQEQASRIAKHNELENYLFHVIGFMRPTMIQQVNEIGWTSQALKDFGNRNLSINTVSALSTDEVNGIKSEDLYRIFVTNREGDTKDKAADILNLRSCFRYIDQQKESYIEFNQTLFSRLDEFRNLWNENLKHLLDLYNQFALQAKQNNINPGTDTFLDFYRNIMVDEQRELILKGLSDNLAESHLKLIQPLMTFIRESKIMDQRILMIAPSVMACDQAFQETSQLRRQKRATVLTYGRNLLGVERLMAECIENTQKRKKHVTSAKNP
ncbi:MAG: hypothetical protein ACJA0H_002493 [Francisellaceae bacterium]|jgi:hypothetical protein